LYQLNIFSVFI